MTTAAKTTFGSELWMGPAGGTLVKVAELLDVTPPRMSRDVEDATTHDSPGGASEFIPHGTYTLSPIPFVTNYIAGSAGDDAMIGYFIGKTLVDWRIVVKAASGTEDMEGSGYLTEYGVDALPVRGKQAASGVIQPTGPVTQAASA